MNNSLNRSMHEIESVSKSMGLLNRAHALGGGESGGSAWESNPPVRQTTDTPVLKTGRPTGAYPLPQIASYLTPPAVKCGRPERRKRPTRHRCVQDSMILKTAAPGVH